MTIQQVTGAFLGFSIGDALGVPVEFQSRSSLQKHPVTDMRAYGTHDQPQGTWSDDSSLSFCLAESLLKGYDLQDLATRFVRWYDEHYWTPHGEVFDVGIATSRAIHRLSQGCAPTLAGGKDEYSNGNGSLMRILPLLFFVKTEPIETRFERVKAVSSLTHGHIRSIMACFYYLEFALCLLNGATAKEAFEQTKQIVNAFLKQYPYLDAVELDFFHRFLLHPRGDFEIKPLFEYPETEIRSSGYVLHTLEASIWCLLHSKNYSETVLKAVNLGEDTDTTATVAGGLAGILYGEAGIPLLWEQQLVKATEIRALAVKVFEKNKVF